MKHACTANVLLTAAKRLPLFSPYSWPLSCSGWWNWSWLTKPINYRRRLTANWDHRLMIYVCTLSPIYQESVMKSEQDYQVWTDSAHLFMCFYLLSRDHTTEFQRLESGLVLSQPLTKLCPINKLLNVLYECMLMQFRCVNTKQLNK